MTKRLFLLASAVVLSMGAFGVFAFAAEDMRKIANVDVIEVGKVGIGVRGALSSEVKQSAAVVTYEPKTNQAHIVFALQGVKNRLFLGQRARAAFIDAVVSYRDDFETRKLSLKAKKTDRVYGIAEGKLEWGSISIDKYSYPTLNFGYLFVDRMSPRPYFTITILKAENLGAKVDDVKFDDESVKSVVYFTKNQATELAEMLLQENLEGILKERGIRDYSEDADVYEN